MVSKDAIKDGAKDAAKATGDFVLSRWQRFRQESPYFQAKVALGVVYVLIVVLTAIAAPPRGEKWISSQERINFGLAFKTALRVTNLRNGDVEDVVVEVHGAGIEFDGKKVQGVWRTKPLTLKEAVEAKILTEHLFDDKGETPPYALEIDTVRVLDEKKRTLVVLRPRQVGAR